MANLVEAASVVEDLDIDLLDDASDDGGLVGDESGHDDEPLVVALDGVIAAFDGAEVALPRHEDQYFSPAESAIPSQFQQNSP